MSEKSQIAKPTPAKSPVEPTRQETPLSENAVIQLQRTIGNRAVLRLLQRTGQIQRVPHADFGNSLEFAQQVLAMYAEGDVNEQKKMLRKLKDVATPFKDSKASELSRLATVIAGGNENILAGTRATQVRTQAQDVAEKGYEIKATNYETRDGGHSLDRHGPNVTNTQLQDRLRTGVAPDGQFSPTTGLSTRFKSHEEYIKTRASAVQGMKTAITATKGVFGPLMKTWLKAKKDFDDSPPGAHKAPNKPLAQAVAAARLAITNEIADTANKHATKMFIRFNPAAAQPENYITMRQSYSIIIDHGRGVGMGFRGRVGSEAQVANPNNGEMKDAWTAWDQVDNLNTTRTGMELPADNLPLFGATYDPETWTAFQHFPVDETPGIQI